MIEEKEIDILSLLGKILFILKKGKFFILLCILLSFALGLYKSYKVRNNHTISFIVGTPIIRANELVYEIILDLQKDIKADNYNRVDKALNLKPNESLKINEIGIDSLPHTNLVKIKLSVDDSASLVYFKQKTISCISNSPFIKNLHSSSQITNQKLVKELDRKISQWDSLQKILFNPIGINNKILSVSPYYKEYVEVLEKKLKIEATLNEVKDGQIITEYKYNIEKVNNKFIMTMLKFGFLGLIIPIFLLLLWAFYKKLNSLAK